MAAALSCGARRSGVSALHEKRAPHPSHHEAASAVNQAEALTHHAGTLNTQVQSWGKGHVWTTCLSLAGWRLQTGKSLPQSWPSLALQLWPDFVLAPSSPGPLPGRQQHACVWPPCSETFQGARCRVLPPWDPRVAPQCLPFLSTSSGSSRAHVLGTLLGFLLFSGFLVFSPGQVPRLPVLSSPELNF